MDRLTYIGHATTLHRLDGVSILTDSNAEGVVVTASATGSATATEWVARLGEAKRAGSLEAELRRLSFVPLLVVDEVGYIPLDPEAANLMFSLVSARYERASLIAPRR
jgi:IstB-like ATP binding protein